MKPTEEQIRRFLAEYEGYLDLRYVVKQTGENTYSTFLVGDPPTDRPKYPPHYNSNLNACHRIETRLNNQQRYYYYGVLGTYTTQLIIASAEHRAYALFYVLGGCEWLEKQETG